MVIHSLVVKILIMRWCITLQLSSRKIQALTFIRHTIFSLSSPKLFTFFRITHCFSFSSLSLIHDNDDTINLHFDPNHFYEETSDFESWIEYLATSHL